MSKKEEDQFQLFFPTCQNSLMDFLTVIKKAKAVDSFRHVARGGTKRMTLWSPAVNPMDSNRLTDRHLQYIWYFISAFELGYITITTHQLSSNSSLCPHASPPQNTTCLHTEVGLFSTDCREILPNRIRIVFILQAQFFHLTLFHIIPPYNQSKLLHRGVSNSCGAQRVMMILLALCQRSGVPEVCGGFVGDWDNTLKTV